MVCMFASQTIQTQHRWRLNTTGNFVAWIKKMKFSEAVEIVRTGAFDVTREEKRDLYLYYKIATCGPKPNVAAPSNPMKLHVWDLWSKNELSESDAKRAYVELVIRITR